MNEPPRESQHDRNQATTFAIVAMSVAVIAIIVAIGAGVVAKRAMDSADLANRRADQAIERRSVASLSVQQDDPQAAFLASIANRGNELDDGLRAWSGMIEQYEFYDASIQYRAFTSFFDVYPLTKQYFFFVSREEVRLNAELPLMRSDRERYEAFRYRLDLRQTTSR